MPPYREPGDDGSSAAAARMRAEVRELEAFRKRVSHARVVRFLTFCEIAADTPAGAALASVAALLFALSFAWVLLLSFAEASHFVDRFVLLGPILLGIGIAAAILVARGVRSLVATAR